jgi:hypothetical protein
MRRKNPLRKVPAGALLVVESFVGGEARGSKLTRYTRRAEVDALAIVLAHGRQVLGAMWAGPTERPDWPRAAADLWVDAEHPATVGHVVAVKGYGPLLYDCTALVLDLLGFDAFIASEEQSDDAKRLWARNAPEGIWSPRYGDDFKKTYGVPFETLLERGQALSAKDRRNYIDAGEDFRAFGDPSMVWTLDSRFGGRLH